MRIGLRAGAPLALAVGVFGLSFGVLARAAGFDPVAAPVMSATTFAGSAQFAVVAVLSAGGSTVSAVRAALVATNTFAEGRHLVVIAAAVAAGFRALGGA